jgi:DNA topoisomerase-1
LAKSLVIVESPAKAGTVNHYLGPDYLVKASMGHVRDLPEKKLGVDVEADFEPTYQVIPSKSKVVAELVKAAKASDRVILAADPDREGEAISWHLSQILTPENPHIYRAIFHEITKEGVQEAFERLGGIDQNKFEAQQTRRILDRLMGYLISPLLWKKIGKGLSAGRVQSVALRLIAEREREIKSFVPVEYWTIAAQLEAGVPPPFKATLAKVDGKKAKVENGDQAREIVAACEKAPFVLEKVKISEKRRSPAPPYITSSLQQDGFRILRFPVKKTMFVAQKLYEGLPIGDLGQTGLITYMRTDSVRVSEAAQAAARKYIAETFSHEHVPDRPHQFKNKKKAQDAHEAIRPAHLDLPPDKVKPFLKKEEHDLYRLIWNRFLASQMASAVVEETEFDIRAARYLFKAKGEVVKFAGFLALAPNGGEEGKELLPKAGEGEALKLLQIDSKQNFTQPPPRFTEGSLVKELEARGIGRPSTYAPIISTLQDRTYVVKDKGKFIPTDLGLFVTDFLVKYFPDLMEYKFTAHMEEELDQIGEGERTWKESLKEYYAVLDKYLKEGGEIESVKKTGIPLDEKCPTCGKQVVIKDGRYGRFKSCSGYPDCRFRESLVKKEVQPLEEACPQCGAPLVLKRGKYGTFAACSGYPACQYVKKEKTETGIDCPTGCGGKIVRRKTRRGKLFYGCGNYPKCTFATWDEPVAKPCPLCGEKIILKKNLAKGEPYFYCRNEKCSYKETVSEAAAGERSDEQGDL